MSDIDHEDRLRRALAADAETVVPAGDGLARIQERIGRRRARLRWLRPLVAVGGAGALAAASFLGVTLTASTPRQTVVGPAQTPTSTATSTPSPTPTRVVTAAPAVLLWPARPESWQSSPALTAGHFVRDYLRLPGLTASTVTRSGASAATVDIGGGSHQRDPAAVVALVEQAGRWYVTGATSTGVSLASPRAGAPAGSPLVTRGSVAGVDVGLHLQLFAPSAPGPIAAATLTTGSGRPWTLSLPYAPTGDRVGTLLAWTDSPVNGGPAYFSVVGVRLTASAPPPFPAYFVGVHAGKVGVYSSLNGALLRTLTTGPSDADPRLTADGTWVYFLADTGGCATRLMRVPFAGGTAQPVVTGAGDIPYFAVGANGGLLAYVVNHYCPGGSPTTVVVRNTATGATNTIQTASGGSGPPDVSGDPSWSPDGVHLAVPVNPGMQQTAVHVYDAFSGAVSSTAGCPLGGGCRTSFPRYDAAGDLTYLADTGTAPQVLRAAAGGGAPTSLFTLPAGWAGTDSFSVAPDGAAALWVQHTVSGGVTLWQWTAGGGSKQLYPAGLVTEVDW